MEQHQNARDLELGLPGPTLPTHAASLRTLTQQQERQQSGAAASSSGLAAFLFPSRALPSGAAETTPLLLSSHYASNGEVSHTATGASCTSTAEPATGPASVRNAAVQPSTCMPAASTAAAAAPALAAQPSAGLRCCRFCLGEEGEDPELGPLITPCLCRDTVHQECLKRWRATNTAAFYRCAKIMCGMCDIHVNSGIRCGVALLGDHVPLSTYRVT